jgi:hypothetical protein
MSKGKIRSEHIDAFKDGREGEIPAELLADVEALVRRQAVDRALDAPALETGEDAPALETGEDEGEGEE